VRQTFLRKAALTNHGNNLVARLEMLDVGANRLDHAGDLRAGCKWHRRFDLVKPLDHERVGKIDRSGFDRHDHLLRPGNKRWDVLENQRIDRAVGLAHQRFQKISALWSRGMNCFAAESLG